MTMSNKVLSFTPSFSLDERDAADVRRVLQKLLEPTPPGQKARAVTVPDDRIFRNVALARKIFSSRKVRSQFFSSAMLNEPGWDMLLALYIADTSEARVTVTRLAEHVGAPLTSALRWIGYLESSKLIAKVICPTDRRKIFLSLTDKGRDAMSNYFDIVAETMSTPD